MTACKHKVSGSISLPSRGPFHLSLTVLLLYRSLGSILAWRVVPPASDGIPRVPPYSGSSPIFSVFAYVILTLSDLSSHTIRLTYLRFLLSSTPIIFLQSVWPSPISLATTLGISFDFSSSPYLDVSVQAVPLCTLFFSCTY